MKRIVRNLSTGVVALTAAVTVSGAAVGTVGATSSHPYRHLHRSMRLVTNTSNTNVVTVTNTTTQVAQSGNATVSGNLFGGSARSGNATNYSNTSTSVDIRN